MPVVHAAIVNHNTSRFSELALRSLVASQTEGHADLTVTVLDNASTDAGLGALEEAAAAVGAGFERTRWPAASTTVNTHGDVLRDFVLARPESEYFLFVDCDIDFEAPGVVDLMVTDIASDEALWAVQARFRWTEEHNGDGTSLDIWAGKPISLRVGRTVEQYDNSDTIEGTIAARCHPGCTLIGNSQAFRRVADIVGFSCAVRLSQDSSHAAFFDTLGLASAAMQAAGYRYGLSRAVVHHFFNASYDDQHVKAREADLEQRLARFEASSEAPSP
jgi:GT2 family glycosyltransferase